MTTPLYDIDALTTALAGPVRLVAIRPASEVLAVGPRQFLHSGPPLRSDVLPGSFRGALIAGLLFEDQAADVAEAEAIIDAGELSFSPCQDTNAAGPLTGVITPNTPVVVAEHANGSTAVTPLHEGDHGGLRSGMFDEHTIMRLRWIRDVIAPALASIVAEREPLDITAAQVSALKRGDECHNRNIASTQALLGEWASDVAALDRGTSQAVFTYLTSTSQLFISLSAAASKVTADTIHRTAGPGLVTGIAMNGHEFGIRVSGFDGWFTAPSPDGPMVPLDGGDITQAGLGHGDSPIIESVGLGACSLTAAPALAQAFGLTIARAHEVVRDLRQITAVDSPVFGLAPDEWRGSPSVFDVAKVAATGIAPSTTLGFMHRVPGAGRVGVGLIPMPLAPFVEAAERLGSAT
ncbi:MAG: DUF1116 domain-containing protein [Acidimicrobiia bacterium]